MRKKNWFYRSYAIERETQQRSGLLNYRNEILNLIKWLDTVQKCLFIFIMFTSRYY